MKYLLLIFIVIVNLSAQSLQKISLQLKWKYQFQFAGFIMAKEKGFYKELGLDVQLKELKSGDTDIVNDILNQKSTFGISDSALIYDKMLGKDIKALFPIFQDSPFMLLGLKRDDLKTLDDIQDKTLAIHDGVDGISVKAMLKAKNISYKLYPPVFDFTKLLTREIDLKTAYISNEPFIAKKLGIDIVTYAPKDYGFSGYGDILFTSNENIDENPKMVQKFYQASKKGWEYAFENIDEAIEIIYYNYNTLNKSKEALHYEAQILKELSGFGKNFGEFNIEKIKGIAQQFNLINQEHNTLQNLNDFIYQPPKEKLKVCFSKDMQPYNFLSKEKAVGYGIDILKLIEKDSEFSFEFIAAGDNRDDFKLLRNKKCDIVPTMVTNVNVTESIKTTIPYGVEHVGIATLMQTPFIEDLDSYKNMKFGFNKKYTNTKAYLKKLYPGIKLVMIDQKDLYKKLATKEIDAYLDGYMFLVNTINQKYYGTLKLNNMIHSQGFNLGMGVHKDNIELLSKLNQLIENLNQTETENILKKWRHFEIKKETDYTLAFNIGIGALLIFLIGFLMYLRDQKLKQRIIELNENLEAEVQVQVKNNRKKDRLMFQQAKLASMGEMINSIAHQWRQPLNEINSDVMGIDYHLVQAKIKNTSIEKHLDNIEHQTEYMSKTIEDFKNYFKPDKEKQHFTISEAVNQALTINKTSLKKYNIVIDLKVINDKKITGYFGELVQVIVNILNNAKDVFIERKIINRKLNITLDNAIFIEDNAGGINEEVIDKVFEPYFTTKHKAQGTGIGLYMSKMIIEESMNGHLEVQNTQNGAKFKIYGCKLDEEN